MAYTFRSIIGFPRWTEEVTFASGSWHASYPQSNLKRLPLARVARTNDTLLASTVLTATLTKPRPIGLVGLCRHSFSREAQFRLRLYEGATIATPLVWTSDVQDVWPVVYPYGTLEWEDDNWWSGKYLAEEIEGYIWTRPILIEPRKLAQTLLFEFFDEDNAQGFIDIGFIEIASSWQLGLNPTFGSTLGFRSRTQFAEAAGGVKYFDRSFAPRVFSGTIDYLEEDEALAKAFEHQRQMDIDKPFMVMLHPEKTQHWLRQSFLARNSQISPLRYAATGVMGVPLAFEEVL